MIKKDDVEVGQKVYTPYISYKHGVDKVSSKENEILEIKEDKLIVRIKLYRWTVSFRRRTIGYDECYLTEREAEESIVDDVLERIQERSKKRIADFNEQIKKEREQTKKDIQEIKEEYNVKDDNINAGDILYKPETVFEYGMYKPKYKSYKVLFSVSKLPLSSDLLVTPYTPDGYATAKATWQSPKNFYKDRNEALEAAKDKACKETKAFFRTRLATQKKELEITEKKLQSKLKEIKESGN